MAIITVFTLQAGTSIQQDLNATADFSNESKAMLNKNISQFPALFDNLFILAFVLLVVGLIITSFLIDTHPIFFILTAVMVVFSLLAMLILSNVYDDLMTGADIGLFANLFPKISYVMTHFVELSIAAAFMTLIALYAKQRFFT